MFSAHGSQPLVKLSTPNLAALGITRAEALKQVATFSSEWDSFGGVGDVVRVSDLTETNVPGLQRALAQMSAPTAPVQKPEGLLRRWFTS